MASKKKLVINTYSKKVVDIFIKVLYHTNEVQITAIPYKDL